ncbi:unnamed protein product [Ilex paraguariensis]|uniref:Uncharacterized protein n=1 Tax=Ilex paraguariensis TaxID=185542 RepID=A0ABC8T3R4_9AQUA
MEPVDGRHGLEFDVNDSPFLSEHAQARQKDVSPVVLPAKFSDNGNMGNHIPLLETFAPAIEALKGNIHESGDGDNILPDKRPAVFLEFKAGKKILGEPLDLSLLKTGLGKTATVLGRDDEKDDRKRRAEYILRQSMENPQELTQL